VKLQCASILIVLSHAAIFELRVWLQKKKSYWMFCISDNIALSCNGNSVAKDPFKLMKTYWSMDVFWTIRRLSIR